MPTEIVVGPDECRFGQHGDVLIARQLSFDCAVVIHNLAAGVGALARFASCEEAIERALEEVRSSGIERQSLVAYVIGGAAVPGDESGVRRTKQTRLAAGRMLWREGVLLRGEDLGGDRARSFRFDPAAGRLIVRTEAILSLGRAAAERAALCHLAS